MSPAACLTMLLCLPLGTGIVSRDQVDKRVVPVLRAPPCPCQGSGPTWLLLARPLPEWPPRALREGGSAPQTLKPHALNPQP